mmetsp:Transcript_85076/g.264320  ORF Transcript_85076/g.264320 Transcript_85076/m.264320 type:complete len:206 (-) Transcript_85076:291-908(-)
MLASLLVEPKYNESAVSERRPARPRATSAVPARASQRPRSSTSLLRSTSAAKASGNPISVTRPFAAAWGQAASAKIECSRRSVHSSASCFAGAGPSSGRPAMRLRMRRRSSSLVACASRIVTRSAAPMISIGKAFSRSVFLDVLRTLREASISVAPSARSCAQPPRAVATSRRKSLSSARRKVIASSNWTHIRLKTVGCCFSSAG